jgi:hypothetical protein
MEDARSLLASVAAQLEPHASSLSEMLVAQVVREIPELVSDKSLFDLLGASMMAAVTAGFQMVLSGDPASAPAPVAIEYARRLAQRGVPVEPLLRVYRSGQAEFQNLMMGAVSNTQADRGLVVSASMELTSLGFAYIDHVTRQIAAEHHRESERWKDSGSAERIAHVVAALADGARDVAETERLIGYSLAQHHVAVVVWADAEWHPHSDIAQLERLVAQLGRQFRCKRAPLVIARDDSTVWAWLPISSGNPQALIDASTIKPGGGIRIAVGTAASGQEGFRLTHHEAAQTQVMAMTIALAERPVVAEWSRFGLVALLSSDAYLARFWLRRALGGLSIDDETHARLRHTMGAFLAAGCSYTAAARELNIHKNTVQYRVRKADEARGRDWHTDRVELEVALRVIDVLGTSIL